jgi:hypothetical protein
MVRFPLHLLRSSNASSLAPAKLTPRKKKAASVRTKPYEKSTKHIKQNPTSLTESPT